MTIDDLDSIFSHLYGKLKPEPIEWLHKDCFNFREDVDVDGLVRKLHHDGYVDLIETSNAVCCKLSYEGRLRFENLPEKYAGQPYRFGKYQQRQSRIWKDAKMF